MKNDNLEVMEYLVAAEGYIARAKKHLQVIMELDDEEIVLHEKTISKIPGKAVKKGYKSVKHSWIDVDLKSFKSLLAGEPNFDVLMNLKDIKEKGFTEAAVRTKINKMGYGLRGGKVRATKTR